MNYSAKQAGKGQLEHRSIKRILGGHGLTGGEQELLRAAKRGRQDETDWPLLLDPSARMHSSVSAEDGDETQDDSFAFQEAMKNRIARSHIAFINALAPTLPSAIHLEIGAIVHSDHIDHIEPAEKLSSQRLEQALAGLAAWRRQVDEMMCFVLRYRALVEIDHLRQALHWITHSSVAPDGDPVDAMARAGVHLALTPGFSPASLGLFGLKVFGQDGDRPTVLNALPSDSDANGLDRDAIDVLSVGKDENGHGLAVTTDIETFEKSRLATSLLRKGVLFDSLLWLRHEVIGWNASGWFAFLPGIEGWLERLLSEIYGRAHWLPTDGAVIDLWERRAGPIPPRHPGNPRRDVGASMRWREAWDEDCIRNRAQWIQDHDRVRLSTLTPLVREAQRRVLARLIDGGIALELNPSSNYRVSGVTHPSDLPFIKLLEEHGELSVATLNSDDPGTFGTRIENEYAGVFHALRQSGMARNRALAVLERLREVGMHHLRWHSDAAAPSLPGA